MAKNLTQPFFGPRGAAQEFVNNQIDHARVFAGGLADTRGIIHHDHRQADGDREAGRTKTVPDAYADCQRRYQCAVRTGHAARRPENAGIKSMLHHQNCAELPELDQHKSYDWSPKRVVGKEVIGMHGGGAGQSTVGAPTIKGLGGKATIGAAGQLAHAQLGLVQERITLFGQT